MIGKRDANGVDHSTSNQAQPVRESSPIDFKRVTAWLEAHVAKSAGPFEVRQFAGGQSNPTYLIATPSARYVVRRKPSGPLLPSAHQIEREYRILRALENTAVPVPRALALCEDATIAGTPFYVMEFLEGRIFRDPALPDCGVAERRGIYESAIDTLVALHSVDIAATGLDDFGRHDGYATRQISRWSKQYEASKTGDIPEMDSLGAWLHANVPPSDELAIAHGDFRIENLVFADAQDALVSAKPTDGRERTDAQDALVSAKPTDGRERASDEPRVTGILDWELSTLGHPLLDLAYVTMMHYVPAHVLQNAGTSGAVSGVPGIPPASELVARYSRAIGRVEMPDMRFFYALAFYRCAAITQGIRKRIAQGNAAGHDAEQRASLAPEMARIGDAFATGMMSLA